MRTITTSFELDNYCFIRDGIEYYSSIEGMADWHIDNDSFDYAGTHCTGGLSGTHKTDDYANLMTFQITRLTLYFESFDKYTNHWFESEKKFDYQHKEHRGFLKFFEEDQIDDLFNAIQEQEDKENYVIEWLHEV